ncbi:MAG: hypothetical protein DI570_00760 [Phenylobacterium zucineum]|nr:MAG: hypothetical protein DI570_00760 [Phenylobacterium zucineum]
MAILIRNPEVERKARELASLRGTTITAALDGALEQALADAKPPVKRRPTVEEMLEATRRLRARAGISEDLPPVTREDFDALWEDDH